VRRRILEYWNAVIWNEESKINKNAGPSVTLSVTSLELFHGVIMLELIIEELMN